MLLCNIVLYSIAFCSCAIAFPQSSYICFGEYFNSIGSDSKKLFFTVVFDNLLLLRMALTLRKRAPIVTLRKHNKKSVRETGKELGTLKSAVGRIVKKEQQQRRRRYLISWKMQQKKRNDCSR